MHHDHQERRATPRFEVSGAIVFYRREQEPIEREHLGILENIGPGGLLLATGEALPTGAVLLMRIYSQAAPPGHSEVVVRGSVQRHSERPRGVGIRFLDTGSRDDAALRGLIATLSSGLRPAPVEALAYC
ncbi:MAG TPA: PilZ domain-containing protein [Thermoanaerobaculia bacterium]|nr:PilZ domain-containing protein [Thermoanaerobaculia bacterium]